MTTSPQETTAFKAHLADNVATLLDDAAAGDVRVLDSGGSATILSVREDIRHGHKIATHPIHPGDDIIKYGIPIGTAACDIAAGAWVHLHNCASKFDGRSSTLDLHTGAPSDTRYA